MKSEEYSEKRDTNMLPSHFLYIFFFFIYYRRLSRLLKIIMIPRTTAAVCEWWKRASPTNDIVPNTFPSSPRRFFCLPLSRSNLTPPPPPIHEFRCKIFRPDFKSLVKMSLLDEDVKKFFSRPEFFVYCTDFLPELLMERERKQCCVDLFICICIYPYVVVSNILDQLSN